MKEKLLLHLKAITHPPASLSPESLLEAIRALDACLEQSRAALHPRLRHFLERRSYTKALAFLESQSDSGAHCAEESCT